MAEAAAGPQTDSGERPACSPAPTGRRRRHRCRGATATRPRSWPPHSAPSPHRHHRHRRPAATTRRRCEPGVRSTSRPGDADLVLITGAEAWRTRMAARRPATEPRTGRRRPTTSRPTEPVGHRRAADHARRVGPRRGHAGRRSTRCSRTRCGPPRAGRIDEHRDRISASCGRGFSEVAATNPHAWIQRAYTAEEIRDADARQPHGRLPVHEAHELEQRRRAGRRRVILCSVERAEALGVPRDRWVFPHGRHRRPRPLVRLEPRRPRTSSPAIRARRAGPRSSWPASGVDDLAHVDLYSCFPSAVQIAAHELGLGTDRPLTVTGGLSFAGGPWNNYVMHSIATMVERPARRPRRARAVTANGGYLTKHAFGVYCTEPPPDGVPPRATRRTEVDALPGRELAEEPRRRRHRRDLRRSCTTATASPSGPSSPACSTTAVASSECTERARIATRLRALTGRRIIRPTVGLLMRNRMARTLNPAAHALRRDAFVDAAQRLMQAKGYEEMTIQDVLDDLDTSRGAFYHYFDSKAALLDAVVERMVDDATAALVPVIDAPGLSATMRACPPVQRPGPVEVRADRSPACGHGDLARRRERDRPREVPPWRAGADDSPPGRHHRTGSRRREMTAGPPERGRHRPRVRDPWLERNGDATSTSPVRRARSRSMRSCARSRRTRPPASGSSACPPGSFPVPDRSIISQWFG